VDNGTTGPLLLLFLFSTTVTKESKETQLLAGPNKWVTKVYSSSKGSLFSEDQNRFNQCDFVPPVEKEGINILRRARKEEAEYV
jgi:hypothetical protein